MLDIGYYNGPLPPCQAFFLVSRKKAPGETPRRLLAYHYPILLCSVSRRIFLDHAAVDIAVALLLLAILLLDQLVSVVDADALDLVAVVIGSG